MFLNWGRDMMKASFRRVGQEARGRFAWNGENKDQERQVNNSGYDIVKAGRGRKKGVQQIDASIHSMMGLELK